MKKIVVGVGLYLSGILLFCADYIVREIAYLIPDITVVSYSNLLTVIGIILAFGGVLLIILGCANN